MVSFAEPQTTGRLLSAGAVFFLLLVGFIIGAFTSKTHLDTALSFYKHHLSSSAATKSPWNFIPTMLIADPRATPLPRDHRPLAIYEDPHASEAWGTGDSFLASNYVQRVDPKLVGDTIRVVHAHHACLHGGRGHIFVANLTSAIEALGADKRPDICHGPEDCSSRQTATTFQPFTPEDIQSIFGPNANTTVDYVQGPAFAGNCWGRFPQDKHPFHLMFFAGKAFEVAWRQRQQLENGGQAFIPPIKTLVSHQCRSFDNFRDDSWPWGKMQYDALMDEFQRAEMLAPDPSYLTLGEGKGDWTCFQNLYMPLNIPNAVVSHDAFLDYRASLLRHLGAEARDHETETAGLKQRCRDRSVRIQVLQRDIDATEPRAFANLDDVLSLAQSFTSAPVSVIVVNSTTSPREQAELFGGFDLLIASHSGGLANLIFAKRSATVIEVQQAIRFYDFRIMGEKGIGMPGYIISTGHKPVPHKVGDEKCTRAASLLAEHCPVDEKSPQKWHTCTSTADTVAITGCDSVIDLDIMHRHIEQMLDAMCKKEEGGTQKQ